MPVAKEAEKKLALKVLAGRAKEPEPSRAGPARSWMEKTAGKPEGL